MDKTRLSLRKVEGVAEEFREMKTEVQVRLAFLRLALGRYEFDLVRTNVLLLLALECL